jgi:hypothetical protein
MKRKSFLKALAALPLVKPLSAAVSEESGEVASAGAEDVCRLCDGVGMVGAMGTLPQEFLDNRRFDYLPDGTGWQITQVPCPECRAKEYWEIYGPTVVTGLKPDTRYHFHVRP